MNVETISGIPIGHIIWDDFTYHKDNIIRCCLNHEKQNTIESGIGTQIKNDLWESKFDFLSTNLDLQPLTNWLHITTTNFINYINKKNYNIAITESWAHVAQHGGFHGPHRHPFSTWSGIFYVYADDEKNAQNVFFNQYVMPPIPGYEFYFEQYTVDFWAGKLIIFPSTMLHYAKPYLGNDKRIVIAFNSIVL